MGRTKYIKVRFSKQAYTKKEESKTVLSFLSSRGKPCRKGLFFVEKGQKRKNADFFVLFRIFYRVLQRKIFQKGIDCHIFL